MSSSDNSKSLTAIAEMRKEKHQRYLAQQRKIELVKKWAPVLLELMNRRRFAASRIVRFFRKHWFLTPDKVFRHGTAAAMEGCGDRLIRFRLTPDKLAFKEHKEEEKVDNNDTIMAVYCVDDYIFFNEGASTIEVANGVFYNLSFSDVKRLTDARCKLGSLRYCQDLEYYRTLAADLNSSQKLKS